MNDRAGIYIHVPFCQKKCAYCDFYSVPFSKKAAEEYTKKITSEIDRWGNALHCSADTLYFGGGTPGLLHPDMIAKMISAAKNVFELEDPEITVEVNPAEELEDFFARIAEAGVNRVSIGLQSAVPHELKLLGRRHNESDASRTVCAARAAGIDNISLDLMLGIPNQTYESLKRSLDYIIDLEPKHISAYMLSLEPGTLMFCNREKYNIPSADFTGELYLKACELLGKAGYERYEISNFAKPGYESKHNLKYWLGNDYLGFGPAAHSFYKNRRFYYDSDLKKYLYEPKEICEGTGGGAEEYIMLRLRVKNAFSQEEFERLYSKELFGKIDPKLKFFENMGLILKTDRHYSFSDKGALISNYILSELLACI